MENIDWGVEWSQGEFLHLSGKTDHLILDGNCAIVKLRLIKWRGNNIKPKWVSIQRELTWADSTNHSRGNQGASGSTQDLRRSAQNPGRVSQEALGHSKLVGRHESRTREWDWRGNFTVVTTGHSRSHFPSKILLKKKKKTISQSSLLLLRVQGSVGSLFWRVVEANTVKEELPNQSRGLVLQTEFEFSGNWTQSIGHSHVMDYHTYHYQLLSLSDSTSVNHNKLYFVCFRLPYLWFH